MRSGYLYFFLSILLYQLESSILALEKCLLFSLDNFNIVLVRDIRVSTVDSGQESTVELFLLILSPIFHSFVQALTHSFLH